MEKKKISSAKKDVFIVFIHVKQTKYICIHLILTNNWKIKKQVDVVFVLWHKLVFVFAPPPGFKISC